MILYDYICTNKYEYLHNLQSEVGAEKKNISVLTGVRTGSGGKWQPHRIAEYQPVQTNQTTSISMKITILEIPYILKTPWK